MKSIEGSPANECGTFLALDVDEVMLASHQFFLEYMDVLMDCKPGTAEQRGLCFYGESSFGRPELLENKYGTVNLGDLAIRAGLFDYKVEDSAQPQDLISEIVQKRVISHGVRENKLKVSFPQIGPVKSAVTGVQRLLEIVDTAVRKPEDASALERERGDYRGGIDEVHMLTARPDRDDVKRATRSLMDGYFSWIDFTDQHYIGSVHSGPEYTLTKQQKMAEIEDRMFAEGRERVHSLLIDDSASNLFRVDDDRPGLTYVGVLFGDYKWTDRSVLEYRNVLHLPSWGDRDLERFANDYIELLESQA